MPAVKPLAFTIALLLSSTALGQNAAPASPPDDPKALEQVTVVGTNLRGVDLAEAQPVIVVTADEIRRTGATNLGDLIRTITATGGGTGEVDAERMKKEWDPNDKKNLPANVYSPMQYLKKASYYYATTADFSKDIENRSTEMDIPGVGRKMVFNCDGVTFVECTDGQGLFFRNDLWVCGRGMIVAAGNIHLKSIRRVDPPGGPPTMLSIVARNGALINNGKNVVEACLYGDRGLMNPFYGSLKIYGNLVVNQFKRSDCQGKIDIHFQANRTHSSLLSYFKDIAKYDPTRYQATFSKKWRVYEFLKN
jgi:hypothetical protein